MRLVDSRSIDPLPGDDPLPREVWYLLHPFTLAGSLKIS